VIFSQGKVKLIDFDWAGQYDVAALDEPSACKHVPDEVREAMVKLHEDGVASKATAPKDRNKYPTYPFDISARPVIRWPEGAEPCEPIRPCHDWGMLETYGDDIRTYNYRDE
jgi:hypothetical protein